MKLISTYVVGEARVDTRVGRKESIIIFASIDDLGILEALGGDDGSLTCLGEVVVVIDKLHLGGNDLLLVSGFASKWICTFSHKEREVDLFVGSLQRDT